MKSTRIYDKISFLKNSRKIYLYEKWLQDIGLKIDPLLWIIISLIIAGVIAFIVSTMLLLFGATAALIMSIVVFAVLSDLLIGYPYIKGIQRITEIESDLPDALKQMSDILKAGGTYEFALREIAQAEFGPLAREMNEVLRKLEEGENFETALRTLTTNVDSRLIKRTVNIIIDSVKAGAGLADILDEIADDVRATNRIGHERKAETLMQVMFMVMAGAIVTPFIYGLISVIIQFLIEASISTGAVEEAVRVSANSASGFLVLLLQIYVFIQVGATSVMISLMREGKKNKSIIYFPALLFIAFIIYFASTYFSVIIIKGF